MKNINHEEQEKDKKGDENQQRASALHLLPRLEMYAVVGLELGKKIFELAEKNFEKLEKVEESLEILVTQKLRELNPDERDEKNEE